MSREDAELVRRSVEMFLAGDVDAAIDQYYAADGEFVSRFGALEGKRYLGEAGARQYFSDIEDAWETYHRELEEVIDAGQAVVAVVRVRAVARVSGVPVERRIGITYWVRERRIARMVSYSSVEEALRAAGQPAP